MDIQLIVQMIRLKDFFYLDVILVSIYIFYIDRCLAWLE